MYKSFAHINLRPPLGLEGRWDPRGFNFQNNFYKQLNQKTMVTITGYRLVKGKDEKDFIALELQSDIEMAQSLETGNFYATTRKASITSTFTEETAKGLIGTKMAGTIKRVESDPYDYVTPDGEVIKLAHRYEYQVETTALSPLPDKMFSLKSSMTNV